MNKKLRERFDLLNRKEQADVAELTANLVSKLLPVTPPANKLLPVTPANKRSEDDIMKSISVTALDFWGEFLKNMYTDNAQA